MDKSRRCPDLNKAVPGHGTGAGYFNGHGLNMNKHVSTVLP